MPIYNVDWNKVFEVAVDQVEPILGVTLMVDEVIIREVEEHAKQSLQNLKMNSVPNVAKVAGHIAFWIRKLKPISHAPETAAHFMPINELIGLHVGMAICQKWFDDHSRPEGFHVSGRVYKDWIKSLRFNSHSPQSTAISFEILAAD